LEKSASRNAVAFQWLELFSRIFPTIGKNGTLFLYAKQDEDSEAIPNPMIHDSNHPLFH